MTTSALPATAPPAIATTAAHAAPSSQPANAPLTRVSLAYIEPRFKLYLRFGEPARTLQLDRWRRCAMFMPGAILCRVRWQANDYGTIRWQLMVMQAATPLDAVQRIPGVQPGACLLLHAEGDANVRAVLERIDGIEALTEPILLGGAPRTVAIANGTLAAAVGLGLQLWIPGVVLWIVGHSLAVWGARVDPQFMQVFARHIKHKPLLDA